VDAILTTSPWRELFWIVLGAVAVGMLIVAVRLGRDALRPRSRVRRVAMSSRPIIPPLPAAPDRTDALEEIEGIGARAAQVLREHGIFTYEQLAALRPAQLRFILLRYEDFRRCDPSTWPFQARLLAQRRWYDFSRLNE
jgi:predicted flap endonuclease-1-like 5' DNA nuclease